MLNLATFRDILTIVLLRYSLLFAFVIATVSGCASVKPVQAPEVPTAEPAKSEPPPKAEKPEEIECRVMNHEGRIFQERASSQLEAEGSALRECQLSYRNCTLIQCEKVTQDEN
jgi:hypothetical protein